MVHPPKTGKESEMLSLRLQHPAYPQGMNDALAALFHKCGIHIMTIGIDNSYGLFAHNGQVWHIADQYGVLLVEHLAAGEKQLISIVAEVVPADPQLYAEIIAELLLNAMSNQSS